MDCGMTCERAVMTETVLEKIKANDKLYIT